MAETLLELFENCQREADMHTSTGTYGYVSFEDVLAKRGPEWLAAHDAEVARQAEARALNAAADALAPDVDAVACPEDVIAFDAIQEVRRLLRARAARVTDTEGSE